MRLKFDALFLLTLVQLYGCAFSSRGIVAIGGDDNEVTLLDASNTNNYKIIEILNGMDAIVCY